VLVVGRDGRTEASEQAADLTRVLRQFPRGGDGLADTTQIGVGEAAAREAQAQRDAQAGDGQVGYDGAGRGA
jgi:hypothetical protein